MVEVAVLGAAKEVTGSCYSLTSGEDKILIDCGMFQGSEELEKLNHENFDFNPSEYKALLLTHAHLDHCGRVPKLIKNGFKGKIYATDATKELAFIVMADAAKIAVEDAQTENKRRRKENIAGDVSPTYNMADVEKAMSLFVTIKYDEEIKVANNIFAKFYDAGHILGSSSVKLQIKEGGKEKLISFSGDLGQEKSVLVKHTEAIGHSDYVFMESTYGDRIHKDLEERRKMLVRVIKETHDIGGKIIIPVFAIERTQEILFYIRQAMSSGQIPKMPVFLDSPMAIRATRVFKKFTNYFNSEVQEEISETGDIFDFPELTLCEKRSESMKINEVGSPCIILAGSGMCTGGRVRHHIANNIENKNNTMLFVGFQVEETLGNMIQRGDKKISLFGREIKVASRIESIEGFSAHADKDDLLEWLSNFAKKPKVFITHGDAAQQVELEKSLEKEGYECHIPSLGEIIGL